MFLSRNFQRVAMGPQRGFFSASKMANKWQPSACLFPTPSFYRLSQITNRSFAGSYNKDYDNDRDSDYNQRGGSRGGYNQGGRDRGNYQQNDRFESRSSYRDSPPEQNV